MRYFILFLVSLFPCVSFAQSTIFIDNQGIFSIQDRAVMSIKNLSLVNNGQFNSEAGTVVIIQDSSEHDLQIRGNKKSYFGNLVLNLSQSDLLLGVNTFVGGTIFLQKGRINLNGKRLILGTDHGQIAAETNENRIYGEGRIQKFMSLSKGKNHPGNLGLEIFRDQPHPPITLIRKHIGIPTQEGVSILRTYKIQGGSDDLKSSQFKFRFLPTETGGLGATSINVWQSQGTNWQVRSATVVHPDSNIVAFSLPGKGSFNALTLGPKHQIRSSGSTLSVNAGMNLYPNPTDDSFLLKFPQEIENELVLILSNAMGQQVQQQLIPQGSDQLKVSMSVLPPGVYHVNIHNHSEQIFLSSIIKN